MTPDTKQREWVASLKQGDVVMVVRGETRCRARVERWAKDGSAIFAGGWWFDADGLAAGFSIPATCLRPVADVEREDELDRLRMANALGAMTPAEWHGLGRDKLRAVWRAVWRAMGRK